MVPLVTMVCLLHKRGALDGKSATSETLCCKFYYVELLCCTFKRTLNQYPFYCVHYLALCPTVGTTVIVSSCFVITPMSMHAQFLSSHFHN